MSVRPKALGLGVGPRTWDFLEFLIKNWTSRLCFGIEEFGIKDFRIKLSGIPESRLPQSQPPHLYRTPPHRTPPHHTPPILPYHTHHTLRISLGTRATSSFPGLWTPACYVTLMTPVEGSATNVVPSHSKPIPSPHHPQKVNHPGGYYLGNDRWHS